MLHPKKSRYIGQGILVSIIEIEVFQNIQLCACQAIFPVVVISAPFQQDMDFFHITANFIHALAPFGDLGLICYLGRFPLTHNNPARFLEGQRKFFM